MMRTWKMPRSWQAARYCGMRSPISRGLKVCKSSTPSMGSWIGSSIVLIVDQECGLRHAIGDRGLETGAGWLMVLVVVVVIDLGVGGSQEGERLPTNRVDTIGVA